LDRKAFDNLAYSPSSLFPPTSTVSIRYIALVIRKAAQAIKNETPGIINPFNGIQ
jgi:hypothetical protein